MRVGVISIQHESNTFVHAQTGLDEFRADVLQRGADFDMSTAGGHHEVAGLFEAIAGAGFEAVPILMARAIPGGTVAAEALDHIVGQMLEMLAAAGKLDGLLVAPHGAGVSEVHRDMDGYWLTLVREQVGAEIPIICTIDPHANLSLRMIETCDATIAYRSNPHLDQRQIGSQAGQLMVATLNGEVKPTQAATFPPVAINIERQNTSMPPCKPMYDQANAILMRNKVLSNSVVLGFPYADVEDMGSSFIVVTDNDAQLAQQLADELGDHLLRNRQQFAAELIGVEEAVEHASGLKGPVCLLDMGDNVGGGSPADSTFIAHELHRRGDMKALVCINDPESAALAHSEGAGQRIVMKIGGKIDRAHGEPLEAMIEVVSLHDGKFTESQVRHGGKTSFEMGPSAVVKTDRELTVLLTSERTPPYSLAQLTSCQLDPMAFQVLVAKGVQAPVAAYEPICTQLVRVNTAGSTSADMASFEFNHRRRPMFPFEEVGA